MEKPLVGVRWLAPVLLSVLLSSGPPSAGGDEGSASARPLGLELELEAPRPDERVRLPVPLVKVSGRAGVGAPEWAQVAVERIRLVERGEGTDISRALGTAEEMLEAAAPVEGPDPARAILLFSDGRFDGFVPLARGENILEVRALLADGRSQRIRRVVHYEQPEAETLEDRRNTAGLLVELRHRTREIGGTE